MHASASQSRPGSHALLEALLAHDVECIFGNPGTTESPFLVALEDFPQLRYILALQEASVLGMADGYARACRRVAVVNIHIAPGLANGLVGLYNASKGGTPLVVTAGQSDTRLLMSEPSLSGDLVRMARQYTKWSHEVVHADDLPLAVHRAIKTALEPPSGPVFLSLPWDVMDEPTTRPVPSPGAYFNRAGPDPDGVAAAAALLRAARKPLLLLGDRVAQSDAVDAVVALAELLSAGVMATNFSEVNFPTRHPQWLGTVGGVRAVGAAMAEADVVVAIGSGLLSPLMYEPLPAGTGGTGLIHIDTHGWDIGKILIPDVALRCDVRAGVAALTATLRSERGASAGEREAHGDAVRAAAAERRLAFQKRAESLWDLTPITPERLMLEIARALPSDAIVVDEAISHSSTLVQAVQPNEPGRYFRIRGGGIGWGLPAALGVAIAQPDHPVVAVVGDGSAMYTIQALWSALHHRIPVVWVICNNGGYRVLKVNLAAYLGEAAGRRQLIGLDLDDPCLDLARIASGFGVQAERVTEPGALADALRRAISARGPYLLDVVIDGAVPGIPSRSAARTQTGEEPQRGVMDRP